VTPQPDQAYAAALADQRAEKDQFFRLHPQSPLAPDQRKAFNGLRYFEPNPALALELPIEVFPEKQSVKMLTNTGETRHYLRWGKVRFTIAGQDAELTLFGSPGDDAFFVPFTDATSGAETYSAGRYVEAHRLTDTTVLLDLNHAYNPYCAYTFGYSCPIPPAENRLAVAIRAGEKTPDDSWVVHE
jgi:hypothetical protein